MRKLAAIGVLGLILAACSADNLAENLVENAIESQDGAEDVDIDSDSDDGSVEFSVEGEDGEGSVTVGGGELPDNFPWALPGGGEVQAVSTSADGSLVSVRYPEDAFDDLAELFQSIYEDEGASNGSTTDYSDPPIKGWSWNTESGGFVSMSVSQQGDMTIAQIIYGDS